MYGLMGGDKARRQLVIQLHREPQPGAKFVTAGFQRRAQARLGQLQTEGGQQLAQLHPGGVQLVADLAEQLLVAVGHLRILHLQAAHLHFHTGKRLGDGVVQLAGDGRALFHDDQLLLFFLMPVERQRGRQLFNQRIYQLLLVVAQVASGWQGGQQNAVLSVAVRQAPLQGRAAGDQRRQAARAKMAAFVIAGHIGLTGKFLVVLFVFHIVDPQLQIAQQGQLLQAIQHR
ncbi:Uncharacterised protein [Klebsiella pneumoniae]|nr:Uncharacterised protein [Klebsiella pneumoniae]